MTVSEGLRGIALIVFCIVVSQLFGQESAKPAHSWDVLMNRPEAKDAASKMVGHCGDAETQDVMNACFVLEFKNADRQMNSTLETTLKQLDRKDQASVRSVQRAWLQYRDLHCQTVGTIQVGVGSMEPTEVNICKADLTKARIKEIRDSYRIPGDAIVR